MAADAHPDRAALLLGACYQRAFFLRFVGAEPLVPTEEFVAGVVNVALRGPPSLTDRHQSE